MPRHWDFEALDARGFLPAARVDASDELLPRLVQLAADNGGTAIDSMPRPGVVHRDDFGWAVPDVLLVDAVQLQDGDHVITVGSQQYTVTTSEGTSTLRQPTFHSRERWQARARLVEALIVRNATW